MAGNRNSGRRKMSTECSMYLKQQGMKSLDVVIAIRDDKENPANVRLDAARYILDQLWGRAPVRVDLDAEGEIRIRIVEDGNDNRNKGT